jgi:predicted GNAT family acetyltransferase
MRLFEGSISSVAIGGNAQKRDKVLILLYSSGLFASVVSNQTLICFLLACDKIFASHSQRIVGVTKKGKDFFKLTSSLTEEIRNMVVEDTRIWTGSSPSWRFFFATDVLNR